MEKGEKVALLAIGVNLLLFAIKYTLFHRSTYAYRGY
jgi:hypothetical protein